jgi:DNA topoisomerase-1
VQLAETAQLLYVNDSTPGYQRKRWGRGFTYLDPAGNHVDDPAMRERFEALVIPPAWTEVWICRSSRGHIQATGRDEAGRKQYIYHPRWEEVRDQVKFDRLLPFGEALPRLREQVDADLRKRTLSHDKVVAIVVRLLEETLIRIGNPMYERRNNTYGLTTLHDDHIDVEGAHVIFKFEGKSHKEREVTLRDRRLARLIKQCQELPGQRLFQYVGDDGELRAVGSSEVNAYLRTVTGCDFSAKDFRTWGGTVAAIDALQRLGPGETGKERERNIVQAIKDVADELGNTPAVCRGYYVHPAIIQSYQTGDLLQVRTQAASQIDESRYGLDVNEATVMLLLRQRLENPPEPE